jgi:hypothetical protein
LEDGGGKGQRFDPAQNHLCRFIDGYALVKVWNAGD